MKTAAGKTRRRKIETWLARFNRCVVRLDYEGAKGLFDADAYCFGSRSGVLNGLDDLVRRQWMKTWPHITRFRFVVAKMHCVLSERGDLACVMMPWTSTGHDRKGKPFPRPGRVTLLLKWRDDVRDWKAIHSHYSLQPGTPAYTRRPGAGAAAR